MGVIVTHYTEHYIIYAYSAMDYSKPLTPEDANAKEEKEAGHHYGAFMVRVPYPVGKVWMIRYIYVCMYVCCAGGESAGVDRPVPEVFDAAPALAVSNPAAGRETQHGQPGRRRTRRRTGTARLEQLSLLLLVPACPLRHESHGGGVYVQQSQLIDQRNTVYVCMYVCMV